MVDGVSQLSSYFTNLISQLMVIERQPLDRLNTSRDTANVKRALYADAKNQIDSLKSAANSLLSTSAFNEIKVGRNSSVTPGTTGKTVLTASASKTAATGSYDIAVTRLAKAHRLVSAVAASPTAAIGKEGVLWIGGNNSPAAAIGSDTSGALSGVSFAGAEVADTISELGSDAYTLETQYTDGIRKFRLRDSKGNAVSIADITKTDGSTTSDWQVYPTSGFPATIDTQRGLSFTLADPASLGASTTSTINYTARGRSVEIAATDSLVDIADRINALTQVAGWEMTGAVQTGQDGTQLVLSAKNTNKTFDAAKLSYVPTSGGAWDFSTLQTAQSAKFSVNGISAETDDNGNISNVLYGVTLNFASDAEGQSATLAVGKDVSGAKGAIETFVEKFNGLQTYLASKTAVTSNGNGTFTRGALSDDSSLIDLRTDLFSDFMTRLTTGTYRTLSDIGLTVNSETLAISISDSSKLEAALKENTTAVTTLLDSVVGKIDSRLTRFSGTNGYMQTNLNSMDSYIKELGTDITDMEKRLEDREDALYTEYGLVQTQLMTMSYQSSMFSNMYGSTSRYG